MGEDRGHLYLLGLLANPRPRDLIHVADFVKGILSEAYKAMAREGLFREARIPDQFLKHEKRKAERNAQRTFEKISQRRIPAGAMALYMMNKLEPSLNRTIGRLSGIGKFGLDKLDKANVYRLIWTETKPVLHVALAILPMIHRIFPADLRPSLDVSGDLVSQIKKTWTLDLRDLYLIPQRTAERLKIETVEDLIKPGWLQDILNVAGVYRDLLPHRIPSVEKTDLIRLI